ncbi:MAG: hypothetical protein AAF265_15525 [Pseudomonadota bacterium]
MSYPTPNLVAVWIRELQELGAYRTHSTGIIFMHSGPIRSNPVLNESASRSTSGWRAV